MNGGMAAPGNGSATTAVATATMTKPSTLHATTPGSILTKRVMASLSPVQQQRYQQDLLEREHQASSLAAAGMVAEKVDLTGAHTQQLPSTDEVDGTNHSTDPNPIGDVDANMNWNLMENMYNMHLDDMDMDFATLFDPVNEMIWNNLPDNNGAVDQSSNTPPPPPSSSDQQPRE